MIEGKKMPGIKNYQFIQVQGKSCLLGFGAYGSVQLGKNLITGQTVAIKKINRKMAFSEVEVHMKLSHQNIIKMLDFYFDQKSQCTYIILQFAENGTLFDFIKHNGMKDKQMARGIFLSVCDAIDYLHSNSVMHRDIKPENILLDKKNMVKLCDFGFAVNCETRMTVCGTAQYMSPEMILKKPYNHKIDIWGLGILFYEMIEGKAPFEGQTQEQVFEKMKKPIQFSKKFSIEEIQIIKSILKLNPEQRPQIKQIIKSLYFKQLKDGQQLSKRSTTDQQEEKKIKIVQVKDIQKEKKILNPQKKIKIVEIKQIQQPLNQRPAQKYEKAYSTMVMSLQDSKIMESSELSQILRSKGEKGLAGLMGANQKISLKKPLKKI